MGGVGNVMANKTFVYEIGCATVRVEAEEDGAARYMVRMSIPGRMARVRIGYLTGARRTWLAEFYGRKRCPISASSAKEACRLLVEWASKQPSVSPYLA